MKAMVWAQNVDTGLTYRQYIEAVANGKIELNQRTTQQALRVEVFSDDGCKIKYGLPLLPSRVVQACDETCYRDDKVLIAAMFSVAQLLRNLGWKILDEDGRPFFDEGD